MSSSSGDAKSIFADLGRATKRGVKKCPKCGFFNGTRGVSCKNKQCDAVFKDVGGKRKACNDAVELDTGNTKQVYSVRVRDKGPDYRGFVQLSKYLTTIPNSNVIPQPALCFVDSCQYLFHDSILKCHEPDQVLISPPMCNHVESALKCVTTATPLPLKNSVICALNISSELRQDLWTLVTQSVGPLVQRVSKYVMAVKCAVTSKHPLGYLHFTFSLAKAKDVGENKYFCTCASFKVSRPAIEDAIIAPPRKCIHYYACICAFASDSKLSDEFMPFINTELPFLGPLSLDIDERLVKHILDSDSNMMIDIREDDQMLPDVCLSVPDLNLNSATLPVQDIQLKLDSNSTNNDIMILSQDNLLFPDSTSITLFTPTISTKKMNVKSLKSINKVKKQVQKEAKATKANVKTIMKTVDQPPIVSIITKDVNLPFLQWLASVTETINQTMHCQFSEKPKPLIFHIPQMFFECLRERISFGSAKKRLPNFTKTLINKDTLPLGTFYKYTWHITNIFHAKQIFDTPLVSLHISKSFTKTCEGYKEINYNIEDNIIKSKDYKPIKPLDVRTYLKVGNTTSDQVEPTPFIIEWIPDVLPITKVGKLQIQFEFGKTSNVI